MYNRFKKQQDLEWSTPPCPPAGIVTITIAGVSAVISLAIALFHKAPDAPRDKYKQLDFDFDAENAKRN